MRGCLCSTVTRMPGLLNWRHKTGACCSRTLVGLAGPVHPRCRKLAQTEPRTGVQTLECS